MKCFVYILSVCLLVQAGSKSILLLHYRLNKEVITARYCINKNKPEKKCAGSCQLHKNLKATEKAQKPFEGNINETYEITLFCQVPAQIGFVFYPVYIPYYSWYQEYTPKVFRPEFFHPPNLVAIQTTVNKF